MKYSVQEAQKSRDFELKEELRLAHEVIEKEGEDPFGLDQDATGRLEIKAKKDCAKALEYWQDRLRRESGEVDATSLGKRLIGPSPRKAVSGRLSKKQRG